MSNSASGPPREGQWPRLRLYWSTLCLGAFVGGTATIASATRVIIQWAKSHDFQLRPLLLSLGAPFPWLFS